MIFWNVFHSLTQLARSLLEMGWLDYWSPYMAAQVRKSHLTWCWILLITHSFVAIAQVFSHMSCASKPLYIWFDMISWLFGIIVMHPYSGDSDWGSVLFRMTQGFDHWPVAHIGSHVDPSCCLLGTCSCSRRTDPPTGKLESEKEASLCERQIWVFPKIGGKPPKSIVENNGKPYLKRDDLAGFPIFLETPIGLKNEFWIQFQLDLGVSQLVEGRFFFKRRMLNLSAFYGRCAISRA